MEEVIKKLLDRIEKLEEKLERKDAEIELIRNSNQPSYQWYPTYPTYPTYGPVLKANNISTVPGQNP